MSSRQTSAGFAVIDRIASSIVSIPRSRTQYARRWVGIEQSSTWLTCAPESVNVIARVRRADEAHERVIGLVGRDELLEEHLEVRREGEVDHELDGIDAAPTGLVGDRGIREIRTTARCGCGSNPACGPLHRWRVRSRRRSPRAPVGRAAPGPRAAGAARRAVCRGGCSTQAACRRGVGCGRRGARRSLGSV